MKKLGFMTCIAGILSLTSCGGQTETAPVVETESEFISVSKDSIYSLNSYYDVEEDIEVRGTTYRYSYSFYPDTSLAVVTNSFGYKYYDNVLDLKIYKDKEEVFSHVFTKKSFVSHITDGHIDSYAFLGFNFNYMKKDDHSSFHFIATVGDPDESGSTSHTFSVDITTDGTISISELQEVDEYPDMSGD